MLFPFHINIITRLWHFFGYISHSIFWSPSQNSTLKTWENGDNDEKADNGDDDDADEDVSNDDEADSGALQLLDVEAEAGLDIGEDDGNDFNNDDKTIGVEVSQ